MFKKLITIAGLVAGISYLYTRLIDKRSYKSFIFELIIRSRGMKKPYLSVENAKKAVNEMKHKTEGDFAGTDYKFKNSVQLVKIQNSTTYIVNDQANPQQPVVMYVHGGAWFKDPFKAHFDYIDTLAAELDAKIIMPIYPKTPHATYKETFELLEEIYEKILMDAESPHQIIIMGDSAGGQISLSFAQHIKKLGLEQPGNIILISPILDATISNPDAPAYEKRDPMLAIEGSRYIIKLWSDDIPLDDWRVSPMFGDLDGLGHITISIGTKEALYPDAVKFSHMLKSKNISHDFLPGYNLYHVHTILPIPERKQFLTKIKQIINKK